MPAEWCKHKAACYFGSHRSVTDLCRREIDGTVEQCAMLKPLECGHERVYLRWTDEGTHYCSACEKELANADAEAEELAKEERRRLERQADTERWETEHADL